MSKNFAEHTAELLAAILKADGDHQKVRIKLTSRPEEVVTIKIPDFLEKSHDFSQSLSRLGVLPSVIFSPHQNRRKLKKSTLAYISYIDKQGIATYTEKELKDLLNSLDQHSTAISDVAPFIWNAFLTWNNLHPNIRAHRKLTEDMVVGYLKQFQTYSHREILDMIETYGKWATAHYRMVEAEEYKPIWFYPTTLSGLLRSNKLFPNHLEGGWKQLIREKQIPDEYVKESPKVRVESEEEKAERLKEIAKYMAQDYIRYGTFAEKEWNYNNNPELKKLVDAELERLKNAN